jgi:uncharacterized protein YjbI with pentapeptide repeats
MASNFGNQHSTSPSIFGIKKVRSIIKSIVFADHERRRQGFIFHLPRRLFPQPRIFISYAREDLEVAMSLLARLEKAGFNVYLDKEKTLAGEQFLGVIVRHLRQCDAVLALLSAYSAQSEWCQAELYYAYALHRTIVPVRLDERQTLDIPAPLTLLQRETQYVLLTGGGDNVLRAIDQRFRAVRSHSCRQWVRRALLVLAAVSFLAWGFHSGFSMFLRGFERTRLISRIEHSQEILRSDALNPTVKKFEGDETLRSRLLAIAEDRERPIHTRLNAHIIAAELGNREKRWYLESLKWSNSRFRNAELNEVTFQTGAINRVNFTDVSFAGVFWNQGPDLSITGSTFIRCRFYSGKFNRTNVVDVDFTNCLFYGTELDVSAFSAVRFESKPDDPGSPVITDGTVTAFERVVIANCVDPPTPGVLDFRGPENEVKFTNVVFESCTFRGFIRPQWFTACSFNRCSFPKSLSIDQLKTRAVSVTECSQIDETCP